ncbi:hypothetical protein GUJ93_ZPchr0001g29616 [Zizania palustris]|uniref:Uncharacterized protein n=1 Tax=Zizania palustris TaxID=103762 RepID=A0A8J5VLZ0_ZIZPA|nr:hypothetical protein GUJ93_ZPchr0001g29616 [Zizania palustris]
MVKGPRRLSPAHSSASHSEWGYSSEGARSEPEDPPVVPDPVQPDRPSTEGAGGVPIPSNPSEPTPRAGLEALATEATPSPRILLRATQPRRGSLSALGGAGRPIAWTEGAGDHSCSVKEV